MSLLKTSSFNRIYIHTCLNPNCMISFWLMLHRTWEDMPATIQASHLFVATSYALWLAFGQTEHHSSDIETTNRTTSFLFCPALFFAVQE